jgi:dGTPase
VSDLISTTRERLECGGFDSVEDVRRHGEQLVALSDEVGEENTILKGFLRQKLYLHPRIERRKEQSRRLLRALFERYMDDERLLPSEARSRSTHEGRIRVVADYIAGMTDRYATDEYRRLFDTALEP